MQPAGQRTFGPQRAGFARQIGEDDLRNVRGQAGVARDLADGNGINQVNMPRDQSGKGIKRGRDGHNERSDSRRIHRARSWRSLAGGAGND